MQITVTFRKVEPTDAIKDYAIEKIKKVEKFLDNPLEAHMVLKIEKFRHIAEITLNGNGFTINAEEKTGDLYSAIDNVMAKVERQIKKYREKIKTNREKNKSLKLSILSSSPDLEENKPKIIKTKNIFVKPMSVEEALEQLSVLKNDFILFTNSETDEVNVIYKRKDGNFGLLELGEEE